MAAELDKQLEAMIDEELRKETDEALGQQLAWQVDEWAEKEMDQAGPLFADPPPQTGRRYGQAGGGGVILDTFSLPRPLVDFQAGRR